MQGCASNARESPNGNINSIRPGAWDNAIERKGSEVPRKYHFRQFSLCLASPLRLPQFVGIALLVTLADQATKWVIINRISLYESLPVIDGFLSITRIHNSGIAFGLFPGISDVFMVITLISIFVVIYFYLTAEPRGLLLTTGCALILGGAVGNLLDRYRFGYVVDFINFSFWPAFNVADSAVSVGVALLLTSFLRQKEGTPGNAPDSF